ncbi:SAM-dependent methyltransferase [Amycolatopsis antarctica]|uniref:SAM-dependent methyltransferase n=1 Tax=Amycolatopsis antarctica TaxID=1854586 RepID=A0A263D0H4_9PSEU|nr:mycofactocin oligosaccharide methyltransferase MftM [Amycolatopsis antarctica]OZM71719.1 SAM-dependent methyltransferase [Amycolatopsis antarctica]
MPRPLDPLGPGHRGWWQAEDLVVCHEQRRALPNRLCARLAPHTVTEHFQVFDTGRRIVVSHRLRPDELDDDLAGLLVDELGPSGWLDADSHFERIFTGVIRSTINDPLLAWTVFYANTLAALRTADPGGGPGAIAGFAPVHTRALELLDGGSVLDLGSCFGFLPMRMAERGRRVIASDVVPGTVRLLGRMAAALTTPLHALVCDAARIPLASGATDTVTAIHLLEHLSPAHGAAVLAEMVRVARRRVVVAVPFEEVPEPAYGHVRTFDLATLVHLGRSAGMPFEVAEHHGGWLVVDVTT